MRSPDLSKILLITALVLYFGHAYWYNTMDFTLYRSHMSLPANRPLLKYMFVNSFFLFVLSAAGFAAIVAVDALGFSSTRIGFALLAASVLLAAGAVRLVMRPRLEDWAKPQTG